MPQTILLPERAMRPIPAMIMRRSVVPFVTSVREQPPRYEDEGSVREARGAVSVAHGAWWSAVVSSPVGAAPATVRVRLQRHGAAAGGAPADADIDLLLAADEVAAVAALLTGVVGQARRDGVLPR